MIVPRLTYALIIGFDCVMKGDECEEYNSQER